MAFTDANPRPKWDIHNPHSSAGQTFVKSMRKIYNPLGFHKGYNFPLFVIGVGALMGFVLARMMYLSWDIFSKDAFPGEMYYYREGIHKVGIILHLAGILPGGFLACFQFVPIIRHKFILFHRLNGYAAILLILIANVGAFMIMDVSVGGAPQLKIWIGVLGSMITLGLGLAIWNIKRLQIDQHRAWMLRVWTWAANVVTLRLLLLAGQHVANAYGYAWHVSIRCSEIFYMYQHIGIPDQGNPTPQLYPVCTIAHNRLGQPTGQQISPAVNKDTWVTVTTAGAGLENAAALVHVMFYMAAWLAIILHVLAVETYLWLTPAESYRLRTVSYEKQIEKGLRQRGTFKDAGLTGTRIGNAPQWWSLPLEDYDEQKRLMLGGNQEEAKLQKLNEPPSGSESDRRESINTLVVPPVTGR